MNWIKAQWKRIGALAAGVLGLVLVFFMGRWRRNGELDLAAAKRELELNTARGESLQKQLDANHEKIVEVASDILTEEIALTEKLDANHELSAADVIARLRARGIIKP